MKTRAQKTQIVEHTVKQIADNRTAVLADFTGSKVNDLNEFKKMLKAIGAKFTVLKKRLLKLAFQNQGIDFDPKRFEGQVGVVFSEKDIAETAGTVYAFAKEKKDSFKILGGFNLEEKAFISAEDVTRFGLLPPREILLGQVVGMIASPIKSLLFVLKERSKKVEVRQS